MEERLNLDLEQLVTRLRQSLGIIQKQDIQIASQLLGLQTNTPIRVGDDCAVIPNGEDYLLLAAEGMWHVLVEVDPWFAGWCAVMVNVSDIAAMGGNAIAVVDTIWTTNSDLAVPILAGMKAASQAYNVPIVGGHTNFKSAYNALSVAILGRAKQLITSFSAKAGDLLLIAIDLRGRMHPRFPFWNAAVNLNSSHRGIAEVDREINNHFNSLQLQEDLKILPYLAENHLCRAGKDISMGGIIGTLLMLIESSSCGAILDLDAIPLPEKVSLETWLLCFPSYGFLLSVSPKNLNAVREIFYSRSLVCEIVGEVKDNSELILKSSEKEVLFWDWQKEQLMGL